ncbi:uncharacterized protein LOC115875873 isoform X2 [Sitophilus oryzae]|nr:uncharacterized protein LOC115875873 isoform X2 [Sitophilus oryzae]
MPLVYAAVIPPPWANPDLNPCARQSRGWQVLFWPPDKKCYKIFKVGYPCPDGMELSPATSRNGKELYAECRCPPGQAFSIEEGKCFQLFTPGPCQQGSYFGSDGEYKNNVTTSIQRLGSCKQIATCPDVHSIFWIKDGKCYQKLTKGPCAKGQLLTMTTGNKLPVCACDKRKELRQFRARDGRCYQHFTRGPCKEKGTLFLPDGTCGCHSFLPHYHKQTDKCFELGTVGPCSKGEIFTVLPQTNNGGCMCKPGNIRYLDNPFCHRPFTRGPCKASHILFNQTHCLPQPCEKGELYYPDEDSCFKIGSRGPCPAGRIISFDFDTRPSIDGVSYNGVCMCETKNCIDENAVNISDDKEQEIGKEEERMTKKSRNKDISEENVKCDSDRGQIRYKSGCFKIYSHDPCEEGAWLVPTKRKEDEDFVGICECTPGHVKKEKIVENRLESECLSQTSILADYLKMNFTVSQRM